MWQNETKRHFDTRDIKGDAERVQQQAYKVASKKEASRHACERLFLGVALLLFILLLSWILGAFNSNFGLSASGRLLP